jgi:hypothetical protein
LNVYPSQGLSPSSENDLRPQNGRSTARAWAVIILIFLAVQFASLFTPPLLDDVDASHAQAAQHMAETGNLVTLYVNGVRYLEKPPLPYWLAAGFYKLFGQNAFATHLSNSLALLGCAIVGWLWAGRAWGRRAGYYSALGILTAFGPFLYTRFSIPDALLPDVGSARPCHSHQRTYRAGVLLCGGHSAAAANRTVAPVAGHATLHRHPAVSGRGRALAHCRVTGQS